MAEYRQVYKRDHPRSNVQGRVLEHVLIAEKALGGPLPFGAEIHHVNGDKRDNSPGNLVICQDRAYHMLLHQRQRMLEAVGTANAGRCRLCNEYERQDTKGFWFNKKRPSMSHHIVCQAAYIREWRRRRNV